jgi:hypothetical protein
MCKCEMREIGSKDCNAAAAFFREPSVNQTEKTMLHRKITDLATAMLDSGGCAP